MENHCDRVSILFRARWVDQPYPFFARVATGFEGAKCRMIGFFEKKVLAICVSSFLLNITMALLPDFLLFSRVSFRLLR
jgi:hypothetical protein